MANNTLIQGAAITGKKFLDVGEAVAKGFMGASPSSLGNAGKKVNNRIAENNAVKNRVNGYMSNMKTDMDFTSFSSSETRTMRNFLLQQRSRYAEAAKMAGKFTDTTDPNYMLYVDQMQDVNNSFTNLAAQLKSYKENKLGFAQTMQDGLYSSGNPTSEENNPMKDASIIYGFYDSDGDNKSDDRYDAPFQIQDGGNIAFNVRGKEITYNNMKEPFLKDNKLINGLMEDNETIYNKGTQGGELNPFGSKRYKESLTEKLQSEDSLMSVIFDYNNVIPMQDIGTKLENKQISLEEARIETVERLTKGREEAFNSGKSVYNAKKNRNQGTGSRGGGANKNSIAANAEAEYKLSQGVMAVELVHPSNPGKKQKYDIRQTQAGGYEIGLVGGNMYEPLESENVFGLDITKINKNSSPASSGQAVEVDATEEIEDIEYDESVYLAVKKKLNIKGEPSEAQKKEILEEYIKQTTL